MNMLAHLIESLAAVVTVNEPDADAPADGAVADEWWVGYLEHFPAGAFA